MQNRKRETEERGKKAVSQRRKTAGKGRKQLGITGNISNDIPESLA